MTRLFYNRSVSKDHSQKFYYLNSEKFQSHELQELALNKLVINSFLFSSLIFLIYYDQIIFLSNKNYFSNNILTT